jgi:hypothetical protein
MAERKRGSAAKSGSRSRTNRPWKDETNPAAKPHAAGTSGAGGGDSPDGPATEDQQPASAPRRSQAGRQDQSMSWQTGPGSGGATQSDGRVKEHEARSGQAGLKK